MPEVSLEQVAKAVSVVASKTAAHQRVQEHALAQQAVLLCAVGALVQTHPDADAFADAFRRCWRLSGLEDEKLQTDSPTRTGIAQALSMLESLCQVRLSVRPPDPAAPPGGQSGLT